MREIKFRAWHTIQKKMYSANELGQDQMTLSADGRGFVNVSGIDVRLSQFTGEKMIPLQYIGLKDKNKKEVYEGDILQAGGDKGLHYEVVFRNGSFAEIHRPDDHWIHYFKDMVDNKEQICEEVIGNVWKNPELLEKTNASK